MESSHVNQNEEKSANNPVCPVGSITYIHDFPIFDLSDDDVLQTEDDLAESSLVDLWEENQFPFLPESNEPMQPIYDTDEEIFKSAKEGEGSLDLCFTPLQLISNGFHMIGGQQPFLSEDEEENK